MHPLPCTLFSDGGVLTEGLPGAFFFYSSAHQHPSGGIVPLPRPHPVYEYAQPPTTSIGGRGKKRESESIACHRGKTAHDLIAVVRFLITRPVRRSRTSTGSSTGRVQCWLWSSQWLTKISHLTVFPLKVSGYLRCPTVRCITRGR